MIKQCALLSFFIIFFPGCSDNTINQETISQSEQRPSYKRRYFIYWRDEVKLDQLLVLDQILLTLKDINNKLTPIPSVLDLTDPAHTD